MESMRPPPHPAYPPSRTSHLRLAGCCLGVAALFAAPARADVEDLSPQARRIDLSPPTLVLRVEGGSDYSPYGYVGGVLSYFNDWSGTELEAGVGAGPGPQLGLALRKLLGERGDFFASEISVGYNPTKARGVDPLNPGSGTHLWVNLGVGFEHRAGLFSYGVTGGLSLGGVSQTPKGFVHGGIGVGIF